MEMIKIADNTTKARLTPTEATSLFKILLQGGYTDIVEEPTFILTHEECVVLGPVFKELMDLGVDLLPAMFLRQSRKKLVDDEKLMTFMCICAVNSQGNDYWLDKASNLLKDCILLEEFDPYIDGSFFRLYREEYFDIMKNFFLKVLKSEAINSIAPTTAEKVSIAECMRFDIWINLNDIS